MIDTFGAYVVGLTERDKVGKVIPTLIVTVTEYDPLTPARCRQLLDEAARLSGRSLVAIEIRNLFSVYRAAPLGLDTIDEKFSFSAATNTVVRTQNGRVVQ